jgi:hypothetical protein
MSSTVDVDALIWSLMVVCGAGIVGIACWLLWDWQCETQQARAAARMVREYCGDGSPEGDLHQKASEFTWPIVAQQPPVFHEAAVTIPIPRSVLAVALPRRPEGEEPAGLKWPAVDVDRSAAGGSHCKTDILPVIYDEWSHKASRLK